ncbi:MAG: S-layer homology domain-containing protein [Bacillota bacterium]|nr:S-layer homology domain-containing protein [Bacillota bacterium]
MLFFAASRKRHLNVFLVMFLSLALVFGCAPLGFAQEGEGSPPPPPGGEGGPPPLYVLKCMPGGGAVGISPELDFIHLEFSGPLDPGTVNTNNITLTGLVYGGEVSVPGNVYYSVVDNVYEGSVIGQIYEVEFFPLEDLLPNTTYTITVSTSVYSASGVPLDASPDPGLQPFVDTFTTGGGEGEPPPPHVVEFNGTQSILRVVFSEPMQAETINDQNVTLMVHESNGNKVPVPGSVSYSDSEADQFYMAVFTPNEPLAPNTTYTFTVSTAVYGTSGLPLDQDPDEPGCQPFVYTFTTGGGEGGSPPGGGGEPGGPGTPEFHVLVDLCDPQLPAIDPNNPPDPDNPPKPNGWDPQKFGSEGIRVVFNRGITTVDPNAIVLRNILTQEQISITVSTATYAVESDTLVVTGNPQDLADGLYGLEIKPGALAAGDYKWNSWFVVPFIIGDFDPEKVFDVVFHDPGNGAHVGKNLPAVVIGFSKPVNTAPENLSKITVTTVAKESIQTPVPGAVGTDPSAAEAFDVKFKPYNGFAPGSYTVTVPGGFASKDGKTLGKDVTFTFTVEDFIGAVPGPGQELPFQVMGTGPRNGETGVPTMLGSIFIGFSRPLQAEGEGYTYASRVRLEQVDSVGAALRSLPFTVSPQGNSLQLLPGEKLLPNSRYRITVIGGSNGVKSESGETLAVDFTSTFTTGAEDAALRNALFGICWFELEPYQPDPQNPQRYYVLRVMFTKPVNKVEVENPSSYKIYTDGAERSITEMYGYDPMSQTVKMLTDIPVPESGPHAPGFSDFKVSVPDPNSIHDAFANQPLNSDPWLNDPQNKQQISPYNEYDTKFDTDNSLGDFDKLENHIVVPFGAPGQQADYFNQMKEMDPAKFDQLLMLPAKVVPMVPFAGKTGSYLVEIPTTQQLTTGDKIVLEFPGDYAGVSGLLSGAELADTTLPPNDDINGPQVGGTVTISRLDKTLLKDGKLVLVVNGTTEQNDYLHILLDGIANPVPSEGTEYIVTIKTLQTASGKTLETIYAAPFFIAKASQQLGRITVELKDAAAPGTTLTGTATVKISSPGTGEMSYVAGNGTAEFSGLPPGEYLVWVSAPPEGYTGGEMPVRVWVAPGGSVPVVHFLKKKDNLVKVTVKATGIPGGKPADVFASGAGGFTKAVVTGKGSDEVAADLYLMPGEYMIGVGPAVSSTGAFLDGSWMAPPPGRYSVSTDTTITINVPISGYYIRVKVQDGSGNVIPGAKVWAYNPARADVMGAFGQTGTDGMALLRVAPGEYKVGAAKEGMPPAPEKVVTASADPGASPVVFNLNKPDIRIVGKVLKSDGAPVPSAPVWAHEAEGPGFIKTMTDAQGQYTLFVRGETTWVVGAFVPGFGDLPPHTIAVGSTDIINTSGSGGSILQVPEETGFAAVSGTVYRGSIPAAFAHVWAEGQNPQGEKFFNGTAADSQGRYVLKVKKGLSYTLRCFVPDFGELPPVDLGTVTGDVPDRNFTAVERTLTIQFGREATGVVSVSLAQGAAGGGRSQGFENKSAVQVKLPAGRYNVDVFVKGKGALRYPQAVDLTQGDQTISFAEQLGPQLLTLKVQLKDAAGSNFTSPAWVRLAEAAQQGAAVKVIDARMTDGTGLATFQVPSGAGVRVAARHPECQPAESGVITVSSDNQTVELTMNLIAAQATSVSGIVSTSDGKPVDSFYVWAAGPGGGWVGGQFQPAGGRAASVEYTLTLPASSEARWTIYAKANGYETTPANAVTVTPSTNLTDKDLTITPIAGFNRAAASAAVTASSGGVVKNADAGVTLVIPAGALGSDNTTASVTTKNVTDVPATATAEPVGAAKEITITKGTGQVVTNFNDQVEIAVEYSPGGLTDDVIDALQLSYWDDTVGDWVVIPSTNDKTNHVLRGYTSHLTKFAVIQPKTAAQQAPSSGQGQQQQQQPTGGGGGGGGGAATAPQPVTSTAGEARVHPAAGGTVGLGSEAALVIPAGVLKESAEVEVKVQKVSAPPAAPAGARLVSDVFEFSVGGRSSYSFAKPVTISLGFNPADLAPDERPAIHYFDEASGQWVNIGGTVSGSTITVEVDHFTKFAVLAVREEAKEETGPAPEPGVRVPADAAGHWAAGAITDLLARGVVKGYPDGTFKPDRTVTRAEFAVLLARALGLTMDDASSLNFKDAAAIPAWARGYIAATVKDGIITGYTDGTFRAGSNITRAELATMVARALKAQVPVKPVLKFSDAAKIPGWAAGCVAIAVEQGIISGCPDNTFRPANRATRAESCTIIVRMLQARGE